MTCSLLLINLLIQHNLFILNYCFANLIIITYCHAEFISASIKFIKVPTQFQNDLRHFIFNITIPPHHLSYHFFLQDFHRLYPRSVQFHQRV